MVRWVLREMEYGYLRSRLLVKDIRVTHGSRPCHYHHYRHLVKPKSTFILVLTPLLEDPLDFLSSSLPSFPL